MGERSQIFVRYEDFSGHKILAARYFQYNSDTAMGMSGQFTYNLGSKPDYNNNWKTGESLDCSGFVEYVFWLVTGQDIGEGTWMQSTENVEGGRAQYISHEELKPGDLAFLMDGRDTIYTDENGEKHTRTNHVGIYCG